jgi:hypothetical protein
MGAHVPFSAFDAIASAILPSGGGVVAISNLYFDESGTHAGARLMTLAGYWFDSVQAARFAREWTKDLRSLGLSHAHMTDCALGFGEYVGMSMPDRIRSEKMLIENIKRRSRFGFSVTINPFRYAEAMVGIKGTPSCYSLLLMLCVQQVTSLAHAKDYQGKLAYFFESGHANANEAQKYMNLIAALGPESVDYHRYAGHSFVDKRIALPLQAADMLAWQTRHYYERLLAGHERPRKDFVALVRPFDFTAIFSDVHIQALRRTFVETGPHFERRDLDAVAQSSQRIMDDFGLDPTEGSRWFMPRGVVLGPRP